MRRSARPRTPYGRPCTDVEARGRVQASRCRRLACEALRRTVQAACRLPDADALHADSCRRGCMLLSHAGDLRANALGGSRVAATNTRMPARGRPMRGRRQAGQHLDTLASGRRRTW
ncbi:hypothetical protein AXF42_Ash021584 [Apostasia shenzhenica]|uniref:Uncharacterized protein n=1 Tax=Apostasia shenzhenica TaxID=1088818 RepID=A0A2H9ZZ11_9ASPA|nr:hypothetical protein AXF42_Ash021584 [Apostasia shenzhenica]